MPADNKNDQNQTCFSMQLGYKDGIETILRDVLGKKIKCGGPPKSGKTRHFDNRKNPNGKKLWQFFMDIAPVFDVRTFVSSRGGGPDCGLFIKMVIYRSI